jgi:hypothetical protein
VHGPTTSHSVPPRALPMHCSFVHAFRGSTLQYSALSARVSQRRWEVRSRNQVTGEKTKSHTHTRRKALELCLGVPAQNAAAHYERVYAQDSPILPHDALRLSLPAGQQQLQPPPPPLPPTPPVFLVCSTARTNIDRGIGIARPRADRRDHTNELTSSTH